MTQHSASTSGLPVLQGIEHGWVQKPERRRRPFALWKWFPREILHRGGSVTRDHERAYRDLQAVRDHTEWE
ncbi:hypothetical protein GCM10027568_03480 [Humibacter soli]